MDRRKFIGTAAAGSAAVLLAPGLLRADPLPRTFSIGFQTYPIRNMLTENFPGTLKTMADMGYQYVEMCYPKGYQNAGFGPLMRIKPADIKKIIEDAGMTCPSCHIGMNDLKKNYEECMRFANEMELKQVITPGLETPGKTVEDFRSAADELNKIGKQVKLYGMTLGLHNHEGEFKMLEGQLIYDAIVNSLDGDVVKMQFQTEVIKLGYKASDYFRKYPGMFISSHLSDWTADGKQVPIGKGVIDWKDFFAAAKTGGVKNFFVEMNFETYKDSASYIHGLLG